MHHNTSRRGEGEAAVILLVLLGIFILAGGITTCCVVSPRYNVYEQEKAGEAELAKAESTRRVTVLEAQAKKDSAVLLAAADVARADGVAKANKIIGDSLKENEAYLRYLWITALRENVSHEVIYVPTEANLPILEAGKRGGPTR